MAVRYRVLWLGVSALLLIGGYAGWRVLDRKLNPERYRGIDMIATVHVPRSWQVPRGRSSPNDQYFPADTGQPPFRVPYKRWDREYWAHDWSLARSIETFDAAAQAAGWQRGGCTGAPRRERETLWECWQRPTFVLNIHFEGTDDSCDSHVINCGTRINVELDERTPDQGPAR
jgi:hypothetical protein